VIVDDLVGENTTLALRQEEEWKLFVKLTLASRRLVRVMDVENTTGKT